MESFAVHALERVVLDPVMTMAMCLQVAPSQMWLWFNGKIESA